MIFLVCPYSATTAKASISTRYSGRASPRTKAMVIVGGLGRRPHALMNVSKPGWRGWPATTRTFHLTTLSRSAPSASIAGV